MSTEFKLGETWKSPKGKLYVVDGVENKWNKPTAKLKPVNGKKSMLRFVSDTARWECMEAGE